MSYQTLLQEAEAKDERDENGALVLLDGPVRVTLEFHGEWFTCVTRDQSIVRRASAHSKQDAITASIDKYLDVPAQSTSLPPYAGRVAS